MNYLLKSDAGKISDIKFFNYANKDTRIFITLNTLNTLNGGYGITINNIKKLTDNTYINLNKEDLTKLLEDKNIILINRENIEIVEGQQYKHYKFTDSKKATIIIVEDKQEGVFDLYEQYNIRGKINLSMLGNNLKKDKLINLLREYNIIPIL